MSTYVLDRQGRYWKKEIFDSFIIDHAPAEGLVVVARCYSADYEGDITVEFLMSQWNAGGLSAVVPAPSGYYAVLSGVDVDDVEFYHDLVPVIAWRVNDTGGLLPMTFNAGTEEVTECAVLHPTGEVVGHDRVWPSLEKYLADREKVLCSRAALAARAEEKQSASSQRLPAD